MNLNQRKVKILESIIKDYISTGEPIGSRTIAKKYDLGVSSATIRNEMSDLEEMGLITQPHSSAGRIPSDKGYRLYVDSILDYKDLSKTEKQFIENTIANNITHIDYLMQQTAKALSLLTNYTTIISKPKVIGIKINRIQLITLDEKSIIAVVINENKTVKNHIINTKNNFDMESLLNLSNIINSLISTYSVEELYNNIDNLNISILKNDFYLIKDIFKEIYKSAKDCNDVEIYTSGVNHLLDFPEFSDLEKAKSIFQTIEEKDLLINLINNRVNELTTTNSQPIQITIGAENDLEQLKDCSIVKTEYTIDNAVGTIGIIGPTRMDYSQTVSVLNSIVKNINKVIKKLSD